jgi:Family of unknown function (DUF6421)
MQHTQPAERFARSVVPAVESLSALQGEDGSFPPEACSRADGLLAVVCAALAEQDPDAFSASQQEAFHADLRQWRERGLDTPPYFDCSRAATRVPVDGELCSFVGPVFLPNSGDRAPRLQAILVRRKEPDAFGALNVHFPHPNNMCQSTQVAAATAGIRDGDCVVFFPENIAAHESVAKQDFAWFFFDKHHRIYARTLRLARAACKDGPFPTDDGELASERLTPDATYQARCVWGYLHDYFHHRGPRPLHKQLALKTQWVQGVLEELKVDCQTALLAAASAEVPYGTIVYEYVLMERLFRYPLASDRLLNSDSASGVLLASWLVHHGALHLSVDRISFGPQELVMQALQDLVDTIVSLEVLADADYVNACEDWLFRFLDRPRSDFERYATPSDLHSSALWSRALAR